MEKISRSNVNNSQVSAKDFPKSGFDLSYKSRSDFFLGFLQPCGYQYIMPADKMSGSTDAKYTFNRLVVPEISDVSVSIHNFYVPFRSIDTSFIKGIVPTELNGMSSSWRVPSFSLRSIFNALDSAFNVYDDYLAAIIDDFESNNAIDCSRVLDLISTIFTNEDDYYVSFNDIWHEYALSVLGTTGTIAFNAANLELVLDALLTPIIGRNSLLDCLGYPYLRSYDIHSLSQSLIGDMTPRNVAKYISDIPCSEYAIRAYYSIWYEHYRDPFLQKRSANLPDWRDFGSTSILASDGSNLICFLLPRIRSWQKDMFVGAMPDDISRHVFAPIYTSPSSVDVLASSENYLDAEVASGGMSPGSQGYVNMTNYKLSYLDPVSGSQKQILCPIPKAVNDALSTLSASYYSIDTYGLDLRDLRKAQMLERYLKRNFYFGDEYQDRMQAHYGSNVSDNSIRRPHLLSSSISEVNPTQEVAQMSSAVMPAGTRTATAQDATHSDAFEFFAEEFGIVITIMSFIPRAQYAPVCPQNLLSQMTDFPLPEFASNNDEFGRVCEIALSGLAYNQFDIAQFAHYPYAHAWRSRVDEVHGSFLDDRSDYTFRRFFGLDNANYTPKLNYKFIACIPNLGMFADTIRLDGQGYYTADHHFYVERVLPTPVEEI